MARLAHDDEQLARLVSEGALIMWQGLVHRLIPFACSFLSADLECRHIKIVMLSCSVIFKVTQEG